MKYRFTLITILLIFVLTKVSALDYFWVGGTGNWSDINHWAQGSGSNVKHLQVPTPTDDVHFDNNSFTAAGQTVTDNAGNAVCRDMNWTGASFIPTFSSTNDFRLYGSLTLIRNMNWQLLANLSFEATSTGKTLTTGGQVFLGIINFNGIGGGWTLQDSLKASNYLYFNNGYFNTNGNYLETGQFISANANPRQLIITNSTIKAGQWSVSGYGGSLNLNAQNSLIISINFFYGGTPQTYNNIILNGIAFFSSSLSKYHKIISTGTINYRNGVVAGNVIDSFLINNGFSGMGISGDTIKLLTVHGFASMISDCVIGKATFFDDVSIQGNNSFDTLIFSPGATVLLASNSTQIINQSLQANGTCTGAITFHSTSIGSQATIQKNLGAVTLNYISLKDIKATGGAPFTANNSVDLGNNTGWTINSAASLQLYWVGGTGNWNDAAHWSNSSGGAGGACLPSAVDDVHFDANSFTAAGQTVTNNVGNAVCRDMNWTGALFTPTFSSTNDFRLYGSLTLIRNMNWQLLANLSFEATSTGKTLTTGGQVFLGIINFNGIGGGWTLQDSLKASNYLYFNNGYFNTNGNYLETGQFISANANPRQLIITNSTIKAGQWSVSGYGGSLNLNAQNSLIISINFFYGGTPQTYNNIILNGIAFFSSSLSKYHKIISTGTINYRNGVVAGNVIDSFLINNGFSGMGISGDTIKLLTVHGFASMISDCVIGKATFFDDVSIQGNNSFDTLIFSPGATVLLASNSTQIINQSLQANGTCTGAITFHSTSIGSQATIQKNLGAVTLNYISLKDIKATGGAPFTANNSVDLGNNTGWTINSAASLQLYWVGGTGNWNDAAHWSNSSGGAGGACLPSAVDDVHFDANSFTAAGQTVTNNVGNAVCRDMNWTGALFTPTFSSTNDFRLYGSLTLIRNMNWQLLANLSFEATSTGKTLTTGGQVFLGIINFNGIGGGWTLQDSLKASNYLYFNNGYFNTNGNYLETGQFISANANPRQLIITNSTIKAGQWSVSGYGGSLNLNAQNSLIISINFFYGGTPQTYNNIILNGIAFFSSSLSKYHKIISTGTINYRNGVVAGNVIDSFLINNGFSGMGISGDTIKLLTVHGFASMISDCVIGKATFFDDVSIQGNNSFDTLIFSPGATVLLASNSTQTVNDILNIKGNGCFPIRLKSTAIGQQSIIKVIKGKVNGDFIEMRDQKATGGASFFAGKYSSNVSDNTGWAFNNGPGYSYGLGGDTTVCASDTNFILNTKNFNGGIAWKWQDGSSNSSLKVTQPGKYFVQVNYANNCFAADTVNVTMLVRPVPTISSNSPICIGDTIKLSASGGTNYSWTGPNGFTSFLQNPFIANAQNINLGFYSAINTIAGCSSKAATLEIKGNASIKINVSISASSTTFCSGDNIVFTATGNSPGTTPTYQWKLNGVNVGTNSLSYSNNSLNDGDKVKCVFTSSSTCADPTSNPAISNEIVLTKTTASNATVSIKASSDSSCTGSNVTFTATPTNGGTLPQYQWKINNVNAGTNSSTFSSTTLSKGDVISCVMTSNASCVTNTTATSNNLVANIIVPVTPNIVISTATTSVCSGTLVSFTSTIANCGSNPSYQWKVNGVNAGTNNNTFSSTTLNNGDVITCVVTSNLICTTSPTAVSNAITMTVNSSVIPSVAISASSTTVCNGTSVTFTSTVTNGGSAPTYQWKVNGTNVSATGPAFSSTTLLNNDVITLIVNSNSPCATILTATSNSITLKVNDKQVPSVTISTSTTSICQGSVINFIAVPINGGSNPTYQWQVNGVNAGTNSSTFSSTTLSDQDVVNLILTSNADCVTIPTAISNSIKITVSSKLTPSVVINTPTPTICSQSSATFTAIPTNGGNTPSYQWKVNGVNAGTNNNTFSSTSLNNGDVITCVVTSSLNCTTSPTAISNAITMTVNSSVVPSVSISASSTTVCIGTSVTFSSSVINGGSAPTYQWKINGNNVSATGPTFSSTSLLNNDIITLIVTSNSSCVSTSTATSNSITLKVNDKLVPSVTISTLTTSICQGSVINFTAVPINGGSNPTYQWQVNGVNAGVNSSTFSSTTLSDQDVVNLILTSNADCVTIQTATSNSIKITVSSKLIPSVVISTSTPTICSQSSATFTAIPTNGGNTPSYQWKVNGVNAGTNSSTFTSSTLNNNDIINTVLTSSEGCASTPNVISNDIKITVNSLLTPTVKISSTAPVICPGTSVTFNATGTNTGNNPTYDWKINGISANVNAAIFTTSNLLNNDVVSVEMKSNATCVAAVLAKDNVSVTVAQPQQFTISASNISDNSIEFDWTSIPGAKGYQVSVDGGTTFINPSSGSNGTKHVVTGLAPNTTIKFIVRSLSDLPCLIITSIVFESKTTFSQILFIPNAFTPNGDGNNDLFMVYGSLKELRLLIFDQWGKMIFSSNSQSRGWDGTMNGKPMASGPYAYLVEAVLPDGSKISKKGSLTLIR